MLQLQVNTWLHILPPHTYLQPGDCGLPLPLQPCGELLQLLQHVLAVPQLGLGGGSGGGCLSQLPLQRHQVAASLAQIVMHSLQQPLSRVPGSLCQQSRCIVRTGAASLIHSLQQHLFTGLRLKRRAAKAAWQPAHVPTASRAVCSNTAGSLAAATRGPCKLH